MREMRQQGRIAITHYSLPMPNAPCPMPHAHDHPLDTDSLVAKVS
ncbi:hypothetical protein [Tolypothrix sp. PCC 7601]|nr:hypothetical protein [Tolypothrix sp. PCC 7601]